MGPCTLGHCKEGHCRRLGKSPQLRFSHSLYCVTQLFSSHACLFVKMLKPLALPAGERVSLSLPKDSLINTKMLFCQGLFRKICRRATGMLAHPIQSPQCSRLFTGSIPHGCRWAGAGTQINFRFAVPAAAVTFRGVRAGFSPSRSQEKPGFLWWVSGQIRQNLRRKPVSGPRFLAPRTQKKLRRLKPAP